MISFVVRDGRHFMAHLKIKRALVELLPTPQSVQYICCNIPELSGQLQWGQLLGKKVRMVKTRVIPQKGLNGTC